MRRWLAALTTLCLLCFAVPAVSEASIAQRSDELRVNRALLIGVSW